METRPIIDPDLYPAGTQIEKGESAVAWPAIWAGTTTAVASSVVLLTIGSGLGLMEGSAWPGLRPTATSFAIGTGIWLIITQWISAALGGYIAGRMRTRWHSLHTDEVFFRDTAHGLLTWATATLLVGAISVFALALAGTDTSATVNVSADVADKMRKAAAAFSLFTAISMLVGAFVASVAGAMGGRLRDRHP